MRSSDALSHTDESPGGDDSATAFSWPPPVDFEAEEILSPDSAVSPAASPSRAADRNPTTADTKSAAGTDTGAGADTAPPWRAQPRSGPLFEPRQRRTESRDSRRPAVGRRQYSPSFLLFGVLALIVAAESVFIVLEITSAAPTRPPRLASSAVSDTDSKARSGDLKAADLMLPASSGTPNPAAGAPAGELQVRSEQSGAVVRIDGRRRGTTPLTIERLAPGPHRIRLIAGKRSVDETVVTEAGVTTSLIVRMPSAATVETGWVDVVTPFEVQIFEGGRLVGTSTQRRLQLTAGEHRLALANHALGYKAVERVRVLPGKVATLQPGVPSGLLSINALPWAEVWIDGRPAGTTPLGNLRTPLGTHEIRFRHPELGEETRHVVVTASEPARVGVEFGR